MSFDPTDIGWRIGRSQTPRGIELWCRYDRTTGVYGEQGSGKTLDLLAPLLTWYRDGVDVQARLPWLSTYLGHVDPKSTYWYLTGSPELLALAAERLEHAFGEQP